MNNFPFYNHWSAEITVVDSQTIDENYLDSLVKIIVDSLELNVVSTAKHLFPTNGGLTKVYILSQSHLIIHTWPELHSLHLDLMTCSPGLSTPKVHRVLSSLPHINSPIFR